MRRWHYVVIGVAFFLASIVATLPAQFAYAMAKKKFAPNAVLVLNGISGTVWSGRAGPAMIGTQRFDSLTWDIKPLALLIGRIQVQADFRYRDSYGKANVARGITGKIYAKNIEARVALQSVRTLAQVLPLGMEGTLLLNLKNLEIDRRSIVAADGAIAWDDAVITVPQRTSFGNLRVNVATESDAVKATLADGGGPLQADGLFSVTRDGNYKFTGAFAVRDTTQPMLAQGLQFIGRPGPDGRVLANVNGHLSSVMSYFEKPEGAKK